MIAYAAIDLRGGRVVQLVGGRPDAERISLPDPVAVARRWTDAGFQALHVIDLDAALGSASDTASRAAIERIVDAVEAPVQVGGGVRDDDDVHAWLDAGAARVIVGTRAVEDRDWLERTAARHPRRLVAAVDVRGDEVVSRGWTRRTGLDAGEFMEALAPLPLAGVLVTDVAREGRMEGADADRFARLAAATAHPLVAAGGIRDIHDLHALDAAGAAGAVLGMALYTGAVDPRAAAREFGDRRGRDDSTRGEPVRRPGTRRTHG